MQSSPTGLKELLETRKSDMSQKLVVNSYDEWTQLREVIVGRVDGFPGFQMDSSFNLFFWENLRPFSDIKEFFTNRVGKFVWPVMRIEAKIVEELRQDIEGLVDALKGLGVSVRRPSAMVGGKKVRTPFWEMLQSPPLNIRDQTIILGKCIVETAPHVRARLFENDYLKPLFREYMQGGARWISMPRPTLSAGTLDASYFDVGPEDQAALQDRYALPLPGHGFEIAFDGAQCLRIGKDILVNTANRNHDLGFLWLKANFGSTFKFHRLNRMADNHVDSIILPLRKGTWLIRDKSYVKFLPKRFRNWELIVLPERKKHPFPSYRRDSISQASRYIDLNVLSVNEDTVIVNSLNPELIEKLEGYGFDVVPVRHRHGGLFGGGFHCFTLDIRREGRLQSYVI